MSLARLCCRVSRNFPAIAMAACLCLAGGLAPALAREPALDEPPSLPAREFRAVWVATVANIDWPARPGLSATEQRQEALAILDQAAAINLNAIVLQVRTATDALYSSDLEPWSVVLSGEQGQPPDPPYDPLAFWVEEAHRRGLQLHAWINPFRARPAGAMGEMAPTHVSQTHPAWVKEYGGMLWMDPGEPEARQHTLDVAADIVRRYDVDGLHIDDYFYPYPVNDPATGKPKPFPDDPSYEAYKQIGGNLARDDWRRQNINQTVEALNHAVHEARPTALFGISPFGIPRPGRPAGVVGFDQYDQIYADAERWLREGWCDYFTPQLYWKIDAPGQPFRPLLDYWIAGNPLKRHLWPGLSISRVGTRQNSYSPDEIVGQIEIIRQREGATGHVLFSQKALRNNPAGLTDRLLEGPYHQPALVPPTPWLGDRPLSSPTIEEDGQTLRVFPAQGEDPFLWVVAARSGERDADWEHRILPAASPLVLPRPDKPTDLAVWAVDRLGNASENPALVRVEKARD